MRLELVSIETDTYPLDGVFYRPEADAGKDAILIMHGNCGNFYTGVPRHLAPLLVQLGYAVLAFNRRGHDILASTAGERMGGAYQRIHEMIEDNQHAECWLVTQGFERPIVIGHSNGGMLAVKDCAGSASVRALVLLSAHMGGENLFRTISEAGLIAGQHFYQFSARGRGVVAAGEGKRADASPGLVVDHQRTDVCRLSRRLPRHPGAGATSALPGAVPTRRSRGEACLSRRGLCRARRRAGGIRARTRLRSFLRRARADRGRADRRLVRPFRHQAIDARNPLR